MPVSARCRDLVLTSSDKENICLKLKFNATNAVLKLKPVVLEIYV